MAGRKDPYEVLGVARDADADAIRKRYRKLARQHHPDLNPGDAGAEERFKDISVAYEVLSDPDRRRNYDEFGDIALEQGFDAEAARKSRDEFHTRFGGASGGEPLGGEFRFGDLDDLLGQVFGAGAFGAERGAPRGFRLRGSDLNAALDLDFAEAVRGGERRLGLSVPGPDGVRAQEISVRIPPGVDDGGQLRVPGKGSPGIGGGPPGDLLVRLRVRPHRVFRREGRDLVLDVPIHVREALRGAQIEVPTLDGRVSVNVPPGTSSGTRLRLKGKGVPDPKGGKPGDLFARIQIRVPKDVSGEALAAIDGLSAFEDPDLRKELFG